MPNPNDEITKLLAAAIPVIVTILGYISYVVSVWVKAHGTAKQWDLITAYGRLTVRALEQMGITGQIENTGQAKKSEAISAIQSFADTHKIKLNVADAEMIVEGALREGVHKGWDEYLLNAAPLKTNDTPNTTQG